MPATTAPEPIVFFQVNAPRLIKELGAMFGSPADTLAEVVQNATRAGATTLDLTLNGRVLTIADDGPGAARPSDLFTAAQSGWADSAAVDPAGIGVFALFSLAKEIDVTSRLEDGSGWHAIFDESAFDGAPIHVEHEVPFGPSGLTIRIVLKDTVTLPSLTHSEWRHCYDITVRVSLNGA